MKIDEPLKISLPSSIKQCQEMSYEVMKQLNREETKNGTVKKKKLVVSSVDQSDPNPR